MILNKVIIENIRSHEYLEFEPAEIGVTSISGENGAGKSTIVDAFAWSLYGTRLHNLKNKNYIREGVDAKSQNVQVTSYITVGNRKYKIRRKLTSNDGACECRVFSYNEDIDDWEFETGPAVSHAESYIRTLLNTDEKGFLSSVFIQQKQVDQIVSASPRERGQVIEKLIGVSAITEGASLVREEARSLQKAAQIIQPGSLEEELIKVNEQKARAVEATNNLKQNKELLQAEEENLKELQKTESAESKIQEKVNSLLNELERMKHNRKMLNSRLSSNLELISHSIDTDGKVFSKEVIEEEVKDSKLDYEKKRNDYNTLFYRNKELESTFAVILNESEIKETFSLLKNKLEESFNELSNNKSKLSETKSKITNTNKYLKLLKSGEGVCPVCGHPITNSEEEYDNHKKELDNLKNIKIQLEESIPKLESKYNDNNKEVNNFINEKVNLLKKQKELLEEFNSTKIKLAEMKASLDASETVFNIAQQKLSNVIANEKSKQLIEAAKAQNDEIQKELVKYTEREKEIQQELSNMSYLSKSEYKSLLNDLKEKEKTVTSLKILESKFLNELNLEKEKSRLVVEEYKKCKQANEDYKELTQQILVMNLTNENLRKFKEQRIKTSIPELTDLASEILSKFTDNRFTQLILTEKFETYVVTDNNVKRPVAQLSGGELSAAAIALRLAIALFLNNGSQHLLILDEVLTAMSSDRSQLILETIASLTNAQIILIAHNEGINSFADKVISL